MIRLIIFLLIPVEYLHRILGTSQDGHIPEGNERKEPTGERMNQKVHIISKENKTHSLMESHELRNGTFVIFVETGKAGKENEENYFNEVSIILNNDGTGHEDNNSSSTEMIQVPMASTQNYSFSDIFISIRNINAQGIVPSYSSSEDVKDFKLESDIQEPGDDKRDIVMGKKVWKKIMMNPKILNQQELNVTTTINTLKNFSENKTFKKILNTPIFYGDI